MTTDKDIVQMLSAFSTGCLDRVNLNSFIEFIDNNGEIPYSELAKMQNAVSLIPIILEEKTPPSHIREKLISKILKMKEAVPFSPDDERFIADVEAHELSDYLIENDAGEIFAPMVLTIPKSETKSDTAEIPVPQKDFSFMGRIQAGTHSAAVQGLSFFTYAKKYVFEIAVSSVFIAIALAAILFYVFNGITNRLNNENAELRERLKNTDIFIKDHYKLITLMNSGATELFNLTPYENSGIIKVYLSLENREGLIQITNLPAIGDDRVYRLWLKSGDNFNILADIQYDPHKVFYEIPRLQRIDSASVQALVLTEESLNKDITPGSNRIASFTR